MGTALSVTAGILLAVFILIVIGIIILAALSGAFESKPKTPTPKPIMIPDTNEGMDEANYRSQNCKANAETGNHWICPENTMTWTEYEKLYH